MKRIYLVFALALLTMTANAQNYVTDLDDMTIAGTWEIQNAVGDFNPGFANDYWDVKPAKFELNDGGYSIITFADGRQWFFKGYWITSAQTGKYFLHLLPWNGGQSIVNFRIVSFNNEKMILSTYSGNGRVELDKDTSAGVSAARMDALDNGKAYGLNGVELPTPDAATGIVIQGGKKILK
jgi:hypothetical protein